MGVTIIINKAQAPMIESKGGKFYRNKFVGVIGIGEETQYNKKTGKAYDTFNFKTEKQMVRWLYETLGEGRYVLIGIHRGKFHAFWKGTVSEDGWMFENQNYIKKQIEWIEKEIQKAEDDEDIEFWKNEMDREKDELKKEKRKYGFGEILKPSGRRGVFHHWDEEEVTVKKHYSSKGKVKKMEEMSVDELNEF